MVLICILHLMVAGVLLAVALTKGFEATLPVFVFAATVLPGESKIVVPGMFDLSTTRVAIIVLTCLYLALGSRNGGKRRRFATPLRYLLLSTLVWNLISAFNSVVFTNSLKVVLSNALDFYVVYYIFATSVTTVRTSHKILAAIVAALTVCCVSGLLETYFGWRFIDQFPALTYRFSNQGYMEDLRTRSTFPHSILFANALTLGIPRSEERRVGK